MNLDLEFLDSMIESMILNPDYQTYLRQLENPAFDGELDENGVDLSLIRESLAKSVQERLQNSSRRSRLLSELLGHDHRRQELCRTSRRLIKVLEDYALAKEQQDSAQLEMFRWIVDRMVPHVATSAPIAVMADPMQRLNIRIRRPR